MRRKKYPFHRTFEKITGFKWTDCIAIRHAAYQALFLCAPSRQDSFLPFAHGVLELFKGERDHNSKLSLLMFLDNALEIHQINYPVQDLASFYEELLQTIDGQRDAVFVSALINMGLEVASREKSPSSFLFLSRAVDYLIDQCGRLGSEPSVKYLLPTLDAVDHLMKIHPSAVVPRYIDACFALMETPLLHLMHCTYFSHQPHERLRKYNVTKENDAIGRLHAQAARNLVTVLAKIKDGTLPYETDDLFSQGVLNRLSVLAYKTTPHKPVNGMARAIISMLDDLRCHSRALRHYSDIRLPLLSRAPR